jgi:hypothetical protein
MQYNFGHLAEPQVMGFLLKVKREKFVLDETWKRMWKALVYINFLYATSSHGILYCDFSFN